MQSFANSLRLTAGAAALLVAFNAGSAEPAAIEQHPLLQGSAAPYMFKLSKTLVEATGDVAATSRTGGFTKALEEKLRAGPIERPQSLTYPNPVVEGMLVFKAVLGPRNRWASENIYVCAEKDGRIIGTYSITPKGDVLADPWAGGSNAQRTTASTEFSNVCGPYIRARGNAMMLPDPAQPRTEASK